jgi:hypothetical protein
MRRERSRIVPEMPAEEHTKRGDVQEAIERLRRARYTDEACACVAFTTSEGWRGGCVRRSRQGKVDCTIESRRVRTRTDWRSLRV